MTRDETVALFLECEARRAEALAAGKSEAEAHETAKGHWNAWAKARLDEMRDLVAKGVWRVQRLDIETNFAVEAANQETREWADAASCRLASLCVETKGWHVSQIAEEEIRRLFRRTKLEIENEIIDLSGFIFPWHFEADFSFFAPRILFNECLFLGPLSMYECEFHNRIFFSGAKFREGARFNGCIFNSIATFNNSEFYEISRLDRAVFKRSVRFENTKFIGEIWFNQVTFEHKTNFRDAQFEDTSSFDACYALRNCNFDGSSFLKKVPSFYQAHFVEASSFELASLPPASVFDRGGANAVRNYRALKRLAIQGHDTDQELRFFSGEVRSARFVSDWPAPSPIWEAKRWSGFFRFWFGILYEIFSDFGRSVFRPIITWMLSIVAFAAFYLSQTEVMQRDLGLKDAWWGSAAAQAGHYAVANTVPCYAPPNEKSSDPNETKIGGLSEKLRSQTNARAEALHLAFRNAFVVLDGGSDASHRMYGCLYGLELYAGQNPVPIVPSAVSTASAIQKLISGVLIFLFGLALRNMLKVK